MRRKTSTSSSSSSTTGPSDETSTRLAELSDERLHVLRHDVAQGQAAARNEGAAVARGRWLAFLDDDDLWAPRKLRLQVDAASASGAGWAYARAIVVDPSLRVLADDPFPAPDALPELLLHGNWMPWWGSNVVVRTELFVRVGGFDESLATVEDWDLWLRLLETGLPAACDEVCLARMEHEQNSVVREWPKVEVAVERMMSKYRPVTDADRRGAAEWLAFEQFRAEDALQPRGCISLLHFATAVPATSRLRRARCSATPDCGLPRGSC